MASATVRNPGVGQVMAVAPLVQELWGSYRLEVVAGYPGGSTLTLLEGSDSPAHFFVLMAWIKDGVQGRPLAE